jgi:uncharacterized protein YjbJ (UPF0337 family)
MNWTQIEGKWEQLKGEAKSKWGKLTDDDLKAVGGKLDSLIGKVVERYGMGKEQARDQVIAWADRLHERVDAMGRSSPQKQSPQSANDPKR